MPKIKRASIRAKLYVQYLNDGFTKKESALHAGYSISTAHNARRAIESQLIVQRYLYRQYGIKSLAARVVGAIMEGTEATQLAKIRVIIVEKDKKDNFKIIKRYNYFQTIPDHKARFRAIDELIKDKII